DLRRVRDHRGSLATQSVDRLSTGASPATSGSAGASTVAYAASYACCSTSNRPRNHRALHALNSLISSYFRDSLPVDGMLARANTSHAGGRAAGRFGLSSECARELPRARRNRQCGLIILD